MDKKAGTFSKKRILAAAGLLCFTAAATGAVFAADQEFVFRYKTGLAQQVGGDGQEDPGTDGTAEALVLDVSAPSPATVGEAWSRQALASGGAGGPYAYSIAPAGSWLSVNPATGLMSGTPSDDSAAEFTVTASDGDAEASRTFSVAAAQALVATSPEALDVSAGDSLDISVGATGGKPPLSYSWDPSTPAPAWMELDPSTGRISGTTAEGSWTLGVVVKDSESRTANANVVLDVQADSGTGRIELVSGIAGNAENGLALAADGSVYLAGSTGEAGSGQGDMLLVKYTPAGNVAWARALGTSADEAGTKVAVGPDGDVFVVGKNDAANKTVVARYSPSGNLVWGRELSNGRFSKGITASADGSVYLIDSNEQFLKMGADGSYLWRKFFSNVGISGAVTNLAIASDANGTYIAGSARFVSAGTNYYHVTDITPAGEIAWSIVGMVGGGSLHSEAQGIAAPGDGHVYLTGWYGAPKKMLVAKFETAAGAPVWERFLPSTSTDYAKGTGIAVDQDGSVLATGSDYNGNWKMAKLDASGSTQWVRQFGMAGAGIQRNANVAIRGGNAILGAAMMNEAKTAYRLGLAKLPLAAAGTGTAGTGYSYIQKTGTFAPPSIHGWDKLAVVTDATGSTVSKPLAGYSSLDVTAAVARESIDLN